jgi:hypothetical protein
MKFMPKRDLVKQLIPVAVIATVAAVLLVAPAIAAKPTHSSAWVAVNSTAGGTSTNLVQGNNLVFTGCGYAAGSNVTIVVASPFATSWSGAPTDSSGCFSSSQWGYTALMSGSYTVNIFQASDKRSPSGTLTFNVS